MKLTYPDYYSEFKCTAGECSDNCCIGWEIDIDEESLCRYQNENSEFSERLKNEISLEGTPHFLLKGAEERCTFLNDRNLCDLILALGEDSLCEICREHPRFNAWYGDVKETGVGLCCEEAARLILKCPDKATFLHSDIMEDGDEPLEDEELFEALVKTRDLLFDMLQNRNYSIWQRLLAALRFGHTLQIALENYLDGDDENSLSEFIEVYSEHSNEFFSEAISDGAEDTCEQMGEILDFFISLEVLDENWHKGLTEIRKEISEVACQFGTFMDYYKSNAYEYEHLAVYFIFRYMLKAVYSGDVLSNIKLMVVSVSLIALIDCASREKNGEFSLEEQIMIVKAFSKEFEYNEENLDTFRDASWEKDLFSTRNLLSVLDGLAHGQ